jgi:hypothetical protein
MRASLFNVIRGGPNKKGRERERERERGRERERERLRERETGASSMRDRIA